MGQDRRRDKPRSVERANLAKELFGDGFPVGSWYVLRDLTVKFGKQPDPEKWRPWVVGFQQPREFGVKAFPRSRTWRKGLWHERHSHGSGCKVKRDAYIQIYDLITLEAKHFQPHRFSCYESEELITQLVRAAGNVLGGDQAGV